MFASMQKIHNDLHCIISKPFTYFCLMFSCITNLQFYIFINYLFLSLSSHMSVLSHGDSLKALTHLLPWVPLSLSGAALAGCTGAGVVHMGTGLRCFLPRFVSISRYIYFCSLVSVSVVRVRCLVIWIS